MQAPSLSAQLSSELARTARNQSEASNPAHSAWVSANAGTGKTHILTQRVVRLLLAGTPPERILCLTYTKAAASEMSNRIFELLASWVTKTDDELEKALHDRLDRPPEPNEMARARSLFAAAIETPGGLKVQTIHAFAERLLQRFPLEAGIMSGFTILDEVAAKALRREAIDGLLTRASQDRTSAIGGALDTAVAYASDDRFDEILTDALSWRGWLAMIPRLIPDPAQNEHDAFDAADALYREHFGVRAGLTPDEIAREIFALVSDPELERLAALFESGSARDRGRGAVLRTARHLTDPCARVEALYDLFFDSNDVPRDSFTTKALAQAQPDLETTMQRLKIRFVHLWREMKGAEAVTATMALTRLADDVLERYSAAKAARGALDFEDLIERAGSLLLTADSAQWVLYKLDSGLDHILVDESQDTSPEQWRIVEALAKEFFSGAGASQVRRTLFAVGDEKQSIYSFQGAAPEMFAAMGQQFKALADGAGATFTTIGLDVSFRSTRPVLETVDKVFSSPERTPGIPQGAGGIRHIARRVAQAGSFELWRSEAYIDAPVSDAFMPLDEEGTTATSVRLANRIAAKIRSWIDSKTMLASHNRPIEPGDILILVRKRQPFAGPMIAALKSLGLPVAGADRLRLTAHIAVQDLISLGNFLTLPEDDLALAEVLKSPIFGFDDDDLIALAHGRKSTLWRSLIDHASTNSRFSAACEELKRWRTAADFTPPYEFWASLLDRDGVRARLLSRLGPEAADPIDEFLNIALTYDDNAPPSLSGFLHALTSEDREIKRDMEQAGSEVRVMTIHGAKGLEAPIVILPDTCSAPVAGNRGGRPIALTGMVVPGSCEQTPFIWPVRGTSKLPQMVRANREGSRIEKEESDRLLYVALTRARDHLIVCGFEGRRGRARGCWYDVICNALSIDPESPGENHVLYRIQSDQTEPPDGKIGEHSISAVPPVRPAWLDQPAPREPGTRLPLAPSRLAPYEPDDEGDPRPVEFSEPPLSEPPALSPARGLTTDRFLRGTLTHLLLQHLPEIAPDSRQQAAETLLQHRAPQLPARARASIVAETLAVLHDRNFSALFGPLSRAEVPIVAEIPDPTNKRPPLRLTGEIDRLTVTDDTVLIVDYKTNRGAPVTVEQVADVYLYQLAAYRLAVQQIFKNHTICTLLLWTEVPLLMEIPSELLDRYALRLWQLDQDLLDGPGLHS